VKRLIAISFLLIFLSANTVFGQLLRLPTLIHHYLEHVVLDNNPSLIAFLQKHYTEKINHADDQHHDHEKLPFKTADSNTAHIVSVVPPHSYSITQLIIEPVSIQQAIYNQKGYSKSYLNSIWQPPRLS
jgi:hypothetical protein